jgi:hypothetical protein
VLLLGGCVAVPQGPTVLVMPGAGKGLEQFRADAGACQQFAQASIGGAGQAAQDNAAADVVGGAAVGAAVGALLGASTGQAGYGAAWGAGTGMMVGGAAAGSNGAASSYTLQRQYDNAYMQCMYTHGNQVPARVAQRTVSSMGIPPRSRYSVPPNAITPPPNTPAPHGYASPAAYGAPPNALTPPPNTPAPPGMTAPGSN